MNIKPWVKRLCINLTAAITLCTSLPSQAQTSQEAAILEQIYAYLQAFGNYFQTVVNKTAVQVATLLYTPNPNLSSTLPVTTSQNQAQQQTQPNTQTNIAPAYNSLFFKYPSSTQLTNTSFNQIVQNQQTAKNNNQVLSLNALLGSTSLNQDQQTQAKNFINSLATPLPQMPGDLAQIDPNNPPILPLQSFYIAAQNYASQQTIGLNNLYELYSERLPQQNLSSSSGLPMQNPSAIQLDEYMASERAGNPQWYSSMETAAPATVQRETLYVLAEIRQEMFQTRMLLEKIYAMQSIAMVQPPENTIKVYSDALKNIQQAPTTP